MVAHHEIMKYDHEGTKKPARVREPVQVYLDPEDQDRLERLTGQLDSSKSEVLRRGLAALERQLTDPSEHPALRVIGILRGSAEACPTTYDVALEHDRFLAESEEASWASPEDPAD